MRFFLIINIILVFGSFNVFGQEELLSGLYFSSHEVIQDKRTSLNLTPEGVLEFSKGFSLEFDAKFRRGDGYYGYIFRIIGDGNTNIDLVSNSVGKSNFWLVYKDQILLSYKWSDLPDADYTKWLKVRVDVDQKNSRVAVTFNGIKREAVVAGISKMQKFEIGFGACKNTSFLSTDVSPMSLKGIKIYDHKNDLFREWTLSKHEYNKVYDETHNSIATVDNPMWIIDRHIKWQKLVSLNLKDLLGTAIDEDRGRIFFVDDKAVYVMSMDSLKLDTIPFNVGTPFHDLMAKQIIYNKYTDEIWSYNFNSGQINKFDFETRRWTFNTSLPVDPAFAHQNRIISPLDSSLVTMMGYGFYTYKSIVNHYNKKLGAWEQFNRIDQIEPRYLAAAGFMNDHEMLVFGGYGSKSGRQELSPTFYYDLYAFDLNNYTFKKLWDFENASEPFVPCESLVVDLKSSSFYTLIYNSGSYATQLRLAKFGIEKSEHLFFADSIPFNFIDTQSWCNLFLNKKTSQLVAIASHNSEVSLYSIAYPPLLPEDVYQHVPAKKTWLLWLVGGLLLAVSVFAMVIVSRRKKNDGIIEGLYKQFDHPNIVPIMPAERKTISSVLLFGGFQVCNRQGENITSAFSPTLKQLFLFVLLHTLKSGKGVSSVKLDEVLWYDKSGESARNNRNVNISKLRTILEEMEGVEIVTENSFWKIKFDESVYCDYMEALALLYKSKTEALNETEMIELIRLLLVGEMIPNLQNEWVDVFKAQFASEIIDVLSALFSDDSVKENFSLRYHLAECILVYDPFNEDAFSTKCTVLYHLGKKSVAKNLYDSFCREYKQALGINYGVAFNDLIR